MGTRRQQARAPLIRKVEPSGLAGGETVGGSWTERNHQVRSIVWSGSVPVTAIARAVSLELGLTSAEGRY